MLVWPEPLLTAYVFCVSTVVGSFLNVVIHRVPRRLSIVRPGSACPTCGGKIAWYDNIPILSWILLRARCRHCHEPISMRYPAVEAVAGVCGVLAVRLYGLNLTGLEVALFAWISIALALIDLDHQILPDVMTYPSILLGLGASWAGGLVPLWQAVIGALIGAALPTMVILLYKLLRGEEGMGWGDVKYLAAIGAVTGIDGCLWILVAAAIVGALFGVVLIALGRGSGKTALPFGSFLAAAALLWLYLPASWRSLPPW
jgi:leader peptidase (prepilin peptidase)/N-methyltransferase